jgi:hypothetical protein
MRKQFSSAWIAVANHPLPSSPDNSPIIDLTLSDEETMELPPRQPPIEFLITDKSAKVRLPERIPSEVLGAHVRHHLLGRAGVLPVVRAWCMDMFPRMYPE